MPRKKTQTKNQFEARLETQLAKAKVKFKYEAIKIPYILARHYIPDFIVETPLGKIYIEAKGYFRPDARSKMAAVKRQHPELDIRIVFYKFTKANERWATKHGFKFAFNTIPQEWLI